MLIRVGKSSWCEIRIVYSDFRDDKLILNIIGEYTKMLFFDFLMIWKQAI